MEQRFKGQDVEVLISAGNPPEPKLSITEVRSFDVSMQLTILKEGYLGETSMRRDSTFDGCAGKIALHVSTQDVLLLVRDIVGRARRELAQQGVRINIKATINMPDGTTPRLLFPNVFFGEIPLSIAGKNEYGSVELPWECEDFDIITT